MKVCTLFKKILDIISISFIFIVFYILLNILKKLEAAQKSTFSKWT